MILKFVHNIRLNADGNISISSEQIVDNEVEAEEAGKQFQRILEAFVRGYSSAS